jgi:O-antigen ligase
MVIKRSWPIKIYILNVLALSLSVFLLISSYSRAAIGGFALSVVCFVIFTFFSNNKYKTSLVKFALIGIGAFIIVLAVDTSLVDSFSKKLNLVIEKNEQKAEEGGNEGRVELYSKSIEYAAEHLGIGMGPGASLVNLDGFPPHNYLIQILVDYGLIILLGQLWILFRVYQRLRIYQHVMQSALPSMVRASILAFPLICVGPSSITGEGVFWLWLGFLIAYSSVMVRKYCST